MDSIGDQLDFYNVYNKNHNIIKRNRLDLSFKDDRLLDNSFIWSGDGKRKDSELFRKEISKYNLGN